MKTVNYQPAHACRIMQVLHFSSLMA